MHGFCSIWPSVSQSLHSLVMAAPVITTSMAAADLLADPAAWTMHGINLRIRERYAGIYFEASRQFGDGRLSIHGHVTLLHSRVAMHALSTQQLKRAVTRAQGVFDGPLVFAMVEPVNLYREDGRLARTLLTLHVQGRAHQQLSGLRGSLLEWSGAREAQRTNFHVSVDDVGHVD